MKKALFAIILAVSLVAIGCGGGSMSTSATSKSNPLDPQGNWLFTLTDNESTPATMTIGGELFELSPPVVTSNTLIPTSAITCFDVSVTMAGHASGTNVIDLTTTMTAVGPHGKDSSIALTGTIAADQAHMSGTWSSADQKCGVTGSGSWTAVLITPLNGTWSGTLTGQSQSSTLGTLSVVFTTTEDVSQTSTTMGQVTGQLTVSGSTCFNPSVPLVMEPYSANGATLHVGLVFSFITAADTSGAVIHGFGNTTDATSATIPMAYFGIVGGPCDGQSFSGTITKQ